MRIFISHGTDKDVESEVEYLDQLESALRGPVGVQPVHDVLLDRDRIQAGDLWRGVLDDWLDECDAAVLLLSQRAIRRPWVHHEATVLAHRRARDGAFSLYTLLLPGVTPADVDASFPCLRLGDVQSFPAGSSPASVAAFVRDRFATLHPPSWTPLDRLEQNLAVQIGRPEVDGPMLEAICEAMTGKAIPWQLTPSRDLQRARTIARAIVRGQMGSVATLQQLMKRLRDAGLRSGEMSRVLDLAAPLWVNCTAASRLGTHFELKRRKLEAPTSELAFALNSKCKRYTPRMYAWRARLPDPTKAVYWIEGGGSVDWVEEAYERIVKAFQDDHRENMPDADEAAAALNVLEEPIFVVLPKPIPDRAMLLDLRARLPNVVFLALTDGTALSSDELPEGVKLLNTDADVRDEVRHQADHASARTVAQDPSPRP